MLRFLDRQAEQLVLRQERVVRETERKNREAQKAAELKKIQDEEKVKRIQANLLNLPCTNSPLEQKRFPTRRGSNDSSKKPGQCPQDAIQNLEEKINKFRIKSLHSQFPLSKPTLLQPLKDEDVRRVRLK